jgi:N-formylmethionyl-tRNA deformylase
VLISNSVQKSYLAGGEGCLSVKDKHEGYVKRYFKIKLKAYDYISQKEVVLSLKNYISIVVQHEFDHLFGILYYDRINKSNPFEVKEDEVKIM